MYGIYSTNLRDKFQLIINIVSFIDFNDTFEDESRLLKKYKEIYSCIMNANRI